MNSLTEQVLVALGAKDPQSTTELFAAVGHNNYNSFRQTLYQATAEGKIFKIARAQYSLSKDTAPIKFKPRENAAVRLRQLVLEKTVLETLKEGPLTRAEIGAKICRSPVTVSRAINPYIENGTVVRLDKGKLAFSDSKEAIAFSESHSTNTTRILQSLSEGPKHFAKLCQENNACKGSTNWTIRRLLENNKVKRVGRGVYAIVN